MTLTTDPSDPRLGHGPDEEPVPQNDAYLVLSEHERHQGFTRPLRHGYLHREELGGCGAVTSMNLAIAETYARNPFFYAATYCVRCQKHRPVGAAGEFTWVEPDGQYTDIRVGT